MRWILRKYKRFVFLAVTLLLVPFIAEGKETAAFKKITQQKNMMHYASAASGEQFWLDWQLIDKSARDQKYSQIIISSGSAVSDINFDCVKNRLSYIPGSWTNPDPGSVFYILVSKVCGVLIDKKKFVLAGTYNDSDLYVAIDSAVWSEGDPDSIDVLTATVRPEGSQLESSRPEVARFETLKINCNTYVGSVSKIQEVGGAPDWSDSTLLQFSKDLTMLNRICDSNRRLIGFVRQRQNVQAGQGNESTGTGRDANILIRQCIANGKKPGTREFSECLRN